MNNNRPIQFITIDNNGMCQLTKESEQLISKINSNVAVICIAGIYRSGKSYLLNRLLGRQDGFEIGPTIASCTKGLWIWGEPIKIKNSNTEVLIIDTEGLASAFEDRNESIDMVIFCLSLLLSSLFIYNSMKNIDESAIENLALVLNFAKKIQSKFKEVGNYVSNFPSFMWVLRDFALELIDEKGNAITPKQYLENALREENMNNTSLSSLNQGVIEEINKKNDIRKLVAYVPQEHILFARSVEDNILLGKSQTSKIDLDCAIKMADFKKDLVFLEEGLDTIVGEYGVTLSGGQKQRLSIARALIKDAAILILDDSLSAVDGTTEANIIRNLKKIRDKKTNIIVAHRLTAVEACDEIVVIENGKIVERGTHNELMKLQGWYYKQYVIQEMGGNENEKN